MKICERCGKETETLHTVRSTLTKKRNICFNCKYGIERFIKYNLTIHEDSSAPIRFDVVSINKEKFIREDLIGKD